MGPLSVKAQVQADAGMVKNQMTVIKTLADEARKKDLHKIKMTKEIAKAKAEGIPLDDSAIGSSDGMLTVPKPGTQQPDTTIKSNSKGTPQEGTGIVVPKPGQDGPSVTLNNPEAGPSDVIPAMLTPGEAVIPASVAQDSAFKPVIEALVEEGRMRNRQPGGVKGFADGTDSLPPMGKMEKRSMWDAFTRKKEHPQQAVPEKKASGGMVDQAKGVLGGRAAQLEAQEKKAMGFADGTLGDDDVMAFESGGNPLANNPNSTATGLYQMLEGARKDVETVRPDLKGKDFKDPAVQEQYRSVYKGLLGQRLSASGIDPTDDNINRAWVVGAGGMKKINDNPDAPLGQTLGQKVVDINPNLKGKTGAEFLADSNPYSRKGVPKAAYQDSVVPRVHRRGGTSGYMRDFAQGMPNQEYDAELAKLARQGTPEEQKIATDEQARLASARGVPPVQTPGGVPAPVASAPAQTTPEKITEVPPIQGEPSGTGIKLKKQADQLESIMQDPAVAQALETLQKTPTPTGEDPKNWLEKGLAKIFGPTGLFNGEDLIRFSILAAGGLLTGGSTGGSLRFAGLHTLKASDDRRAGQAAAAAKQAEITRQAQAEAAKNIRERVEGKEKEYHQFTKNATDEAKSEAAKYLAKADKATTVAEREMNLDNALRVLSANQADKEGGKKFGTRQTGIDAATGLPVDFYDNKENKRFVVDKNDNPIPVTQTKMRPIPRDQYEALERKQEESAQAQIKNALNDANRRKDGSKINKDIDNSYYDDKSKAYAKQLMGLRKYFGYDMEPEAFGKLMNATMGQFKEELRTGAFDNLSNEAMTKTVLGNAVINNRPSSAKYYKAAGTESGRPSTEATSMIANLVEAANKAGRNTDEFISGLEQKFDAEMKDPKKKKSFEDLAKATPGYSPFLLWVKGQKTN